MRRAIRPDRPDRPDRFKITVPPDPRRLEDQVNTDLGALFLALAGTSIGVATVLAVAIAKDWTPILEPLTVLPAPLVGAATGLLAGLYPSWKAGRIEPVEALRR